MLVGINDARLKTNGVDPNVGCGPPANASQSACFSRSMLAYPMFGHGYPRVSGSVGWFRYACIPNSSHAGRVRLIRRYATPMSWMKRYGEREMLLRARHSSFSRDETEVTIATAGSTAFTASYVFASTRMYVA